MTVSESKWLPNGIRTAAEATKELVALIPS